MKLALLSFGFLLSATITGFYDISFETLDGNILHTSSYRGEKVIVTVISANAESSSLLNYLDSLQQQTDSLRVIAIPTGDFNGNITLTDLSRLQKNPGIIITKPANVKKGSAAQHPMFIWLTDMQQNNHFNRDVTAEGQVFIVSAKGTLYSVLPKGTPTRIITKAVTQPFTR